MEALRAHYNGFACVFFFLFCLYQKTVVSLLTIHYYSSWMCSSGYLRILLIFIVLRSEMVDEKQYFRHTALWHSVFATDQQIIKQLNASTNIVGRWSQYSLIFSSLFFFFFSKKKKQMKIIPFSIFMRFAPKYFVVFIHLFSQFLQLLSDAEKYTSEHCTQTIKMD